MTGFGFARDTAPTVGTTAERAARFGSPVRGFKVFNVEVGAFQRWTGSAWVNLPTTVYDVTIFGADPTGSSDSSAAIAAADSAVCNGTLGLDGATVVYTGEVYFPPGTYRVNSTVTYRGAPWRGAGIGATTLKYYGASGACIDALGVTGARKLLDISSMTISGASATGTAYGLRAGWNQRSMPGLRDLRITGFPGVGLFWAGDSWNMTFDNLYLSFNRGGGIGIDPTVTSLNGFTLNNFNAENNGANASGIGGAFNLTDAIHAWVFNGGVIEGNLGLGEFRITDSDDVVFNGTYFEVDAGASGPIDGLLIAGSATVTFNTIPIYGISGVTGKAIRAQGTSRVSLINVVTSNFGVQVAVEDTAIVREISEGTPLTTVTVAAGAAFVRSTLKQATLVTAGTVAVNATLGTAYVLPLSGNVTIGTPTNPSDGQEITFLMVQDATGSRSVSWTAPTWKHAWSDTGNAASTASTIRFVYLNSRWWQVGAQSPYVA